jgi:hypothetical protein
MKKIIQNLLLAAGLSILVGCNTLTGGTTGTGGTNTTGGFSTAQEDLLIKDAASTGTFITLMAKPEYKPAFQAAIPALTILSQTNTVTVPQIQALLKNLNVNGVNTPAVGLAIGDAMDAMDVFGFGIQSLPQNQQLAAVQGMIGVLTQGIQQGLDAYNSALTTTNTP